MTLKKLYNCPKEAIVRLQKLLQSNRSLRVVVWVPVVILSLQRLLRLLALTPPAAAAPQLYIINLYREVLSHRSIDHSTKISYINYYCMWLYNLIFAEAS